ncbi:hypothetical protein ATI61_12648 [Archangium gephyra]|uniref:Lipoprotein n=1 Tax=Archangium gephyra TaxID=48 RepID=A0ABX9JKK3_9BACT|nr:hypothetical protein [Archangium gephyra]REG15372.1 hypothetical protein ATI61_12648 [Archangium gephyra]
MPHRFVRRWGGLVAGCWLLGACASTPGREAPRQYALDSLSASCLKNPLYCATVSGREVATGPVQTVGAAVASAAAVGHALTHEMKTSIQEEMEECADKARTEVLSRLKGAFEGLVPKAAECKAMTVDAQGRSVTWAIRLGLEMHEVALACAQAKLGERGLKFSLKPRYRFNLETKEKSLITPEEKAELLRQGGEELKGTLEPDVVIHTGDPLQVLVVYDFKFRCVGFEKNPEWRRYPVGHRYAGQLQGDIYRQAFGPEVHLIGPRKGMFW